MNRVVVTGLGCITPIGNSIPDFRTALFAGTTGIAPFPPYPEAPAREAHDKTQGLRFTRTAAVKDFDARQHLDSGIVTATDRTTHFAIVAARQAALESQLTTHFAPEKIAIIVGCACGGRQAEETEDEQSQGPRCERQVREAEARADLSGRLAPQVLDLMPSGAGSREPCRRAPR